MARLRRIVVPGQVHLIIHRVRSGSEVFRDAADRLNYVRALADAALSARVAIHAYALLPAEVRLLVSPEDAGGLALLMQAAGRRYVRSFNQKYGSTGTPWEGRFRSAVIEPDAYFLPCLRYVEGSAEAVASLGGELDGLSSAAHHLGLRVDPLIADHPAIWGFGNTPFERHAAYRRFFERAPGEGEVATILLAALNGWVLGSREFAAAVADQTGRRPQRARRGRPRLATLSR